MFKKIPQKPKRKLASIQIISDIKPIENADRIVQATIMGWNVIVIKNEFKIGDRCVFFEYDSILPDGPPWSEFLRPKKFKVKTCRLRGIMSQGLALPLSILNGSNPNRSFFQRIFRKDGWKVGTNVTEFLKIDKHISGKQGTKSGFKGGLTQGNFPNFIPKTDEIRIQSEIKFLNKIKDKDFYVTVKCDGTSSTFYNFNGNFGACSRNRMVKEGDNIYWDIVNIYKLRKIPDGIAIQGEIVGPKICSNHMRLEHIDIKVFDVFDIKAGKYLDYYEMRPICQEFGLPMVPLEFIWYINKQGSFDHSLGHWLELAKGKYENTIINREGLVVRTMETNRISFKVINNEYLLKEDS